MRRGNFQTKTTVPFFRDLPIKRKLTVAVLGTTTIALLVACAAFVAYERVTFRRAMERNLTVLADALALNSTVALSFAKDQDTTGDAEETLKALGAEPAVVAACLYNDEGAVHATYARAGGGKAEFPTKAEKEGTWIEGDFMVVVRPVVLEGKRLGTIYLRADLSGLSAQLRLYAGISALVLLGSFLLALALSTALQGLILQPILSLTDTAKHVSQTRDYSARAERQGGGELGLLTDAFNQMLGDIEGRASALQHANESLREQNTEMVEAAAVLASSADQIAAATRELSGSASAAASAVSETTATVEEVRQTSQLSSERAKSVSDQSQAAAEIAKGGKRSVNQTIEGMNGIRTQMTSIAECILGLSAQSEAIGEIIASVDDIAAQSHLLAVNAAIEAAKAGEEGKGFSVVAEEVKSLAQQSKQATTQVRVILSDIQKATSRAVLATEQGSKAVETGVQQSSAAGESIAALADSIAGAAQAATQIAAASHQQFAGMEQVAIAMESIKTASSRTLTSTRQVEDTSRQLGELGQKLQQIVQRLKV
ncbi:MAG: hypothetical protein QOE70_5662 [Chthoniobacter sp.]|nr:hypothetical protein [Chthoniobacter sp.]